MVKFSLFAFFLFQRTFQTFSTFWTFVSLQFCFFSSSSFPFGYCFCLFLDFLKGFSPLFFRVVPFSSFFFLFLVFAHLFFVLCFSKKFTPSFSNIMKVQKSFEKSSTHLRSGKLLHKVTELTMTLDKIRQVMKTFHESSAITYDNSW